MGLTDEQAKELAQKFRDIADSLKNYKLKNWGLLSKHQQTLINEAQLTLYEYSQEMITQAVGFIVDEAQCSLEDLKKVIGKANHAIKSLQEVAHVIDLATAVTGLAFTIINNPVDIGSAIEKLAKCIGSGENERYITHNHSNPN